MTIEEELEAYRKEKIQRYAHEYYLAHRKKILDYNRQWRANHPGYARKYRLLHPENHNDRNRRWREAHPEEARARYREYYWAHHDKMLEKARLYRAEKKKEANE